MTYKVNHIVEMRVPAYNYFLEFLARLFVNLLSVCVLLLLGSVVFSGGIDYYIVFYIGAAFLVVLNITLNGESFEVAEPVVTHRAVKK